ncbi:hypothetical protein GCM10011332_21190 [Terasakiella brassicae]|uniref:Uncharacterized protein n=1 Tax=Terasakiella brassicae TaxID=1634917 RepID=A0A917C3V0_9PROT|nr:hypothetical protein [Terasakiella brassicae]GGF66847.1 hypothetical protein GCM10011332_21190 [Terasakiella brassicae]
MMQTEELYKVLTEAEVIRTQGEFSQICGRKFSWASSAISSEREMSLEATLACYCNLLIARDAAAKEHDFATCEELNGICKRIWNEICCEVGSRCQSLAA